jgi:flagellar basal-body rod protein FlgB
MSLIDPVTLSLVKSALDAGLMRQTAHAANIANAGTPGFRPFAVTFEENLGEVRDAIDDGTLSSVDARSLPAAHLAVQPGTAPVQLDAEVAAMSADALHYQALTHVLSEQYAIVNLAMSSGDR